MPDEVTPNDMPGVSAETVEAPASPATVTAEAAVEPKPTETLEFWKQKSREQERRAKQNHEEAERLRADATKWQDLVAKTGAKEGDEFDPRAEIDKMRQEIASERRERTRADIAREKNVHPRWVLGDTEDAMRESADAYLADIAAAVPKTVPAAAPASEVTSGTKVEGQKQLTEDDLKSMSPKQIIEARNSGQLDDLMGK